MWLTLIRCVRCVKYCFVHYFTCRSGPSMTENGLATNLALLLIAGHCSIDRILIAFQLKLLQLIQQYYHTAFVHWKMSVWCSWAMFVYPNGANSTRLGIFHHRTFNLVEDFSFMCWINFGTSCCSCTMHLTRWMHPYSNMLRFHHCFVCNDEFDYNFFLLLLSFVYLCRVFLLFIFPLFVSIVLASIMICPLLPLSYSTRRHLAQSTFSYSFQTCPPFVCSIFLHSILNKYKWTSINFQQSYRFQFDLPAMRLQLL